MTSVMVTGGLGFVGRHLVRRLVADGHQVVSYNRDFSESADPAVTSVQGELFDIPRLIRTLDEHAVQGILHTAAMSHPELSVELPVSTFAANVYGTLSVLESARMAGVRRIVNFSSECAYGHQETEIVREDARLRPITPYGVTKVTTEMLADVYTDLYGLDVVSLRITEVYGPGNPMPEVLREMIAAAVHDEPYALDHGAEQRFQFIHVEDVARAACAAAVAAAPSQRVYNITGGSQISLAETAALVHELLGGPGISVGPGYIPNLDRQGPWDISPAGRDLGYRPGWALEEGIRSYAEWLRENRY
ncbi:MAG TPA: NAD-dependent epimerase/dehydratase family protein [Solirubrobacteraceae bacterium]|nr:NAD-dependent epimerase/dehydratase family protein [Solirubrobacteraceae bacterium]